MAEALRPRESAGPRSSRRAYLDWVRGIAVLIMIEAHVIDSWTGAPDRSSKAFEWAMALGGFGAPLFLLLAGVSVSLSAGAKARRTGDASAASRTVMRRGLEIFLLAFVFRVQAWILGWAAPWTLLRVDILNVMGPAIVAAAWLWGLVHTPRRRAAVFVAATLATAFLTPVLSAVSWLAPLPDPIEAYLRPAGGYAGFTLLPWAGFVFAGAGIGVLLDRLGTDPPAAAVSAGGTTEAGLNRYFGIGGAVLALVAYAGSLLPTPYARSDFWTTSPAFFLLRLGLLVLAIGLSYAWERRPGGTAAWSPVRQLGRTSLFIYWIHVEMVYGLVSLKLHHALTLPQAGLGLALFSLLMLACSIGKDRLAARWRRRQAPLGSAAA